MGGSCRWFRKRASRLSLFAFRCSPDVKQLFGADTVWVRVEKPGLAAARPFLLAMIPPYRQGKVIRVGRPGE